MSLHPVIHAAFAAWCAERGRTVSAQVEALMAALISAEKVRTK